MTSAESGVALVRSESDAPAAPTRPAELGSALSDPPFEAALLERMNVTALGAAIGVALTAGETLRDSLEECCEAIVSHLGAAFARIWTVSSTGGFLELQASAGLYTHLDGAHARIGLHWLFLPVLSGVGLY